MPEPITKPKVTVALVDSPSGPIDDYTWTYNGPSSIVYVTAKHSYQDRFKIQKTKIEKLEDEVAKLQEADIYANHVVMRCQVYTRMGRAIHNEWFMKLPRHVKAALCAENLYNLPRLFTIWWLSRSSRQPNDFTLPSVFAQFPDYSIHDEDDDLTPRLFDDNGETELGRVVARAWSFISSVDRSLMVYCWGARQQEKAVRDGIAYPTTSVAEAKAILTKDMSTELRGLHTRAIVIVDNSKGFFK